MAIIYSKDVNGNLVESESITRVFRLKALRAQKAELVKRRIELNAKIDVLNEQIAQAVALSANEE